MTRGGSEAVGICGHVTVGDLRGLRWAMACGKAKPQLRVLLAGHSSSDLRRAQEHLQSQGSAMIVHLRHVHASPEILPFKPLFRFSHLRVVSAAIVCLNHEQARKALSSGNFDVAVVEVCVGALCSVSFQLPQLSAASQSMPF